MPFGMFTDVNELQPLKARSPMDVTLSGMVMDGNEGQKKAA